MEKNDIILGGGCFWCLEAVFNRLKGVLEVKSGYTGGHIKNPAYREVCNGTTGHAEVIKISFDPNLINIQTILDLFFIFHNPTTLNRQGNDVGTQYRSAIYYKDESQKSEAYEACIRAKEIWMDPIITEITPRDIFYPAEDYHQGYYDSNPNQGYCNFVISPKISKLKSKYSTLLKQQ